MKIIFVDIDGPITYGTWMQPKVTIGDAGNSFKIPYPWVQAECDALAKIINETGAKVVISSDWRLHYNVDQMNKIFEHYNIPDVIIDTTSTIKAKMSSNLEMDRAYQIMHWVREHKDLIKSWVALDDLRLAGYFDQAHEVEPYIHGDRHIWLEGDWSDVNAKLSENVEKIIEILNKEA
jgi:hypothetical protein